MTITKEALTYLHELELNPDWTKIPDSDSRIIKLRELFEGIDKGNKTRRSIGYKVQANIKGVSVIFNNATECAVTLGFNRNKIYEAISTGYVYKGMTFEKVEE